MIDIFEPLNKDKMNIVRNNLGVAQEKCYGVKWSNQGKDHILMYEHSIYPIFAKLDELIIIFHNEKQDLMSILTLNGITVKKLSVPIVDKHKCTSNAQFLYPEINKLGKLLGVIFSDGYNDYRATFHFQNMEFDNIKKIKI